jgi:hypothetical protein
MVTKMSGYLTREEAREILNLVLELSAPLTPEEGYPKNQWMVHHHNAEHKEFWAVKRNVAARALKMLGKLSQPANHGQKPE